MTFLIDECLHPSLVGVAEERDYKAHYLVYLGMQGWKDPDVLKRVSAGTYSVKASTGSVSATQNGILVEDTIWVLSADDSASFYGTDSTYAGSAGAVGGSAAAGAIAFDHAGNAWVTKADVDGYAIYTPGGVIVSSATGGGLHTPVSVAVDGAGNAWFANAGNGSLAMFSGVGTQLSPDAGFQPSALSSPSAIIVDNSGSIWVANAGNDSVTRVIGLAAPVRTPTVTAVTNQTLGARP